MKTKTKTTSKPDMLSRLKTVQLARRGPVPVVKTWPPDAVEQLRKVAIEWHAGRLRCSSEQIKEVFAADLAERGISFQMSPAHFGRILRDLSQ